MALYCAADWCEATAAFIVVHENGDMTPLCSDHAEVYRWGQASPGAEVVERHDLTSEQRLQLLLKQQSDRCALCCNPLTVEEAWFSAVYKDEAICRECYDEEQADLEAEEEQEEEEAGGGDG